MTEGKGHDRSSRGMRRIPRRATTPDLDLAENATEPCTPSSASPGAVSHHEVLQSSTHRHEGREVEDQTARKKHKEPRRRAMLRIEEAKGVFVRRGRGPDPPPPPGATLTLP